MPPVRMLTPVLAVLALVLGGVVVSAAPVGTSSSVAAETLLTKALAAAERSGSVRFIDKSTSGPSTQVVNGAISAPAAEEISDGNGATFSVELINAVVYVNGPAAAIQNALAITAAQAAPVAGKWIAVANSDAPFSALTQALTLDSELDEFTPTANIHFGKTQKLGTHRVIPISGDPPANTSKGVTGGTALLVSAASPHYPLGGSLVLAHGKDRLKEVAVFSKLGEHGRPDTSNGGGPVLLGPHRLIVPNPVARLGRRDRLVTRK